MSFPHVHLPPTRNIEIVKVDRGPLRKVADKIKYRERVHVQRTVPVLRLAAKQAKSIARNRSRPDY